MRLIGKEWRKMMKNEQKKLALNTVLFAMDAMRNEIEAVQASLMIDSDYEKIERLSNCILVLSEAWKNIERGA